MGCPLGRRMLLPPPPWSLPTGAKLSLATTNGLGSSSSNLSTTSVTLTQPLLKNGGVDANTASVRVARLDEQINRLSLKSTLSQTVVQVVSAYRGIAPGTRPENYRGSGASA